MDTSPIDGFITRKHASERCKRSERTLQRYWSRAIEHQDETVLTHLKLDTEDGEIIQGPKVTKELIDRLKKDRRNPTWYVHAQWVDATYAPRLEEGSDTGEKQPAESPAADAASQPTTTPDVHVLSLLQERITQLEQDKHDLKDELKIKNDQINQANERDRETHVLMRDLHELLRDMQQRLPAPAATGRQLGAAASVNRPPETQTVQPATIESEPPAARSKQGSDRRTNAGPKTEVLTPAKKTAKRSKRAPKKKQPATFLEKHTPTFHKAFTSFFRR